MKNFTLIFLFLSLLMTGNSWSNIMTSKTFIKFDENKRTQSVEFTNTSKEEKKYRVEIVNFIQKEDGGYEEIKEEEKNQYNFLASDLVYVSPKIFTLKPRETQIVKLFKKNANFINCKDGEYRSHLSIKETEYKKNETATSSNGDGLTLNIKALFGLTIPVILTKGNIYHKTQISSIKSTKTEDGKPAIEIILTRTGNESARGDIDVLLKGKKIAISRNLNIFYPAQDRTIKLNLFSDIDKNTPIKPENINSKEITINYIENKLDKSIVTDSKTITY